MVRTGVTKLLVLAAAFAPGALGAQESVRPLEVEDVIELSRLGASQDAQADLVRSSCIAFPVDQATVTRLRAAGTSDALVRVLETACFAGAELVVETDPAGADVFVDNQRVGASPWTGRFAGSRSVQVAVKSGARTLDAAVTLARGQRAHAAFHLPEDVVPVPAVRSVQEIADQLDVARFWQPVVPMPEEPTPPGSYGAPISWLVNLGGAAYGGTYCRDAGNHCWIEPIIEDDGSDSMEPLRIIAGAGAGLVAGMVVNGIIGKVVNSVRRGSYEGAVTRRTEWERSNAIARADWVRAHPDVLAVRRDEERARADAEAWNRGVTERNQARRPVSVTSEPLRATATP